MSTSPRPVSIPPNRNRFLNLLSSIGRDVIVILSTHIVDDVRELCPRMAIIANGRVLLEGSPSEALDSCAASFPGPRWLPARMNWKVLEQIFRFSPRTSSPVSTRSASTPIPIPEMDSSLLGIGSSRTSTSLSLARPAKELEEGECTMRLFASSSFSELKLRFKSISTYVYFAIWFTFSFLCIASENFGPIAFGNGQGVVEWSAFANIYNDTFASFFGLIIIGAIFGTSILRDFQRDTTQILFTKPISKSAYLGGRWAALLCCDHIRIFRADLRRNAGDARAVGPTITASRLRICGGTSSRFSPIVLPQIFFTGSLFFMVAALTRRIFIHVYVQGAGLFMIYLIGFAAPLNRPAASRYSGRASSIQSA